MCTLIDANASMKRERSALEEDSSGSFFSFQRLCKEVGENASYTQKTVVLTKYIDSFNGDLYLLCKLLLCKQDLRKYHVSYFLQQQTIPLLISH